MSLDCDWLCVCDVSQPKASGLYTSVSGPLISVTSYGIILLDQILLLAASQHQLYGDSGYWYTFVAWVSLSVTTMNFAKTDDSMKMPFEVVSGVGQSNHVLDGGPDPH